MINKVNGRSILRVDDWGEVESNTITSRRVVAINAYG
jgi:hypothetical protein